MSRTFTLSVTLTEYPDASALETSDQHLLLAARDAATRAYAPYSKFLVGAAVLLGNGEIITGNNQENAAYPSGLCAERVAAFHAKSLHPQEKIVAIAVHASSAVSQILKPVSPCGSCRQALLEYEEKDASAIRLIMSGASGPVVVAGSVSGLLPLSFGKKDLK